MNTSILNHPIVQYNFFAKYTSIKVEKNKIKGIINKILKKITSGRWQERVVNIEVMGIFCFLN